MDGKVEMSKDDIIKSVNDYIDEIFDKEDQELKQEVKEEEINKAKAKEDEPKEDEVEKAAKAKDDKEKEKEKKKKEVKEEDEDGEDEDGEDEESHKKSYMKDKTYKKGFMNALKYVKEKAAKKSVAASGLIPTESEEDMELKKSISTLTEQMLSLTKSVEAMAKQPAGLRKSVRATDIIKKSSADGKEVDVDESHAHEDFKKIKTFMKSKAGIEKISDILFEDGFKKSLLSSRTIAEFESTKQDPNSDDIVFVSDPKADKVIKGLIQARVNEGTFFN